MKNVVVLCAVVMLACTGCGKKSAAELFTMATESQQAAQHSIDSLRGKADVPKLLEPVLANYEAVFNEHPESAEAEQALFKIAELYSGKLNQPEKAIDAFKRYVAAFPASARAQTAMFMVGYLYNNTLGNIDSAKAAYTRFLERFPNSELTTSAQYELNNLGKQPEELLPEEPAPEPSKVATTVKPRTRK
jgi:outer membrane protein assembly factor BamD (BamD/ComL family)